MYLIPCSVASMGMATKLNRMISLILVAMFIRGKHSGVIKFCGYDFGAIHHGQLQMGRLYSRQNLNKFYILFV